MRNRTRASLGGALLAVALLAAGILPDDRALLEATRRGDVAAVKAALKEGADVNAALGDGLTALHLAAQEGNLEVAKVLLGAKANVEAKTRIGDYTPLHLAAGSAHLTVVQALLAAGAKPGPATTTSGVTPLHLAAKALGGEMVVKALLDKGAPVNPREASYGQTPLMFAAAAGRAPAVRELMARGADAATQTEVVDVLRSVALDKAADQRIKDAIGEIRKASPEGTKRALTAAEVQKAIAEQRKFLGSKEEVSKALSGFTPDQLADTLPIWDTPTGRKAEQKAPMRPRWETWVGKTGGMTALLYAARDGHTDVVTALLDGGADIDEVAGGDGSSALLLATMNGQFETAMTLIKRGANPNLAANTDGIAPLFATLQTQWAAKFTENYVMPRAQDNASVGYMDVLNALLAAGANPNVRLKTHLWYFEMVDGPSSKWGLDITGATPFWRAAFAQDVDAMKALVAHGADPNIPTSWPELGMRNGVGGSGRQQDGRIMEDSGLEVIPEGAPNMYPIHAAAGGGYLGLGAFLVNNVPNNFKNAVKYLVEEQGADVNLPDSWGYTPLHYAAVHGSNDLIEYLVSKGADVTAVARLGQSAVDMARGGRAGYFSRTYYPETVELLTRLGSPFRCLDTHFRGTGDYCPGSGVAPFDGAEKFNGAVSPVK